MAPPMLKAACILLLSAGLAQAAPSACPEHFARGRPPDLVNPRLATDSRALCYRAFALLHSGATRTALYAAERLTRDSLRAARETPRQGEFHADPALPPGRRAELADYARSGFDRGHLAPSGDMPDAEAQEESFTLANMIPQAPRLNRGLWEGMESAVRAYATRRGLLYVVTGPAFHGATLDQVGQVLVPTHVWKAVFDPRRGTAAAYVAVNDTSGEWEVVSIDELTEFTGLDVFPGMTARARRRAMRLPEPGGRP